MNGLLSGVWSIKDLHTVLTCRPPCLCLHLACLGEFDAKGLGFMPSAKIELCGVLWEHEMLLQASDQLYGPGRLVMA
jgi:hypothetical protein